MKKIAHVPDDRNGSIARPCCVSAGHVAHDAPVSAIQDGNGDLVNTVYFLR